MNKKLNRQRRTCRTRMKIREGTIHRLSVFRTPRHIYAQISSPDGASIVVSASTLDKAIRDSISYGGNVSAASAIGKEVAERAKARGIESVAFDRSGYKYHGRIKALADAAREHGLKF